MDNHTFWENRSKLGFKSCSNDIILKKLEIKELKKHILDGKEILDIGCGNGITSVEICKDFDVNIDAFDFSESLIEKAKELKDKNKDQLKGRINFFNLNMLDIDKISKKYDIIITERALINLKTFEEQKKTIIKIFNLLKKSGIYLMCENSIDGLNGINKYRQQLNLSIIQPPWHNCYFEEAKLNTIQSDNIILQEKKPFTSSYYILSRIVNAHIAKLNNEEPKYESDINKIGLLIDALNLDIGQTKLWIWKNI